MTMTMTTMTTMTTRKLTSIGTRAAALGILAAALLGGAGCSEYKYFDIHVTFDPTMYDISTTQEVRDCRVTVSGPASSVFTLPEGNCPNRHAGTAGDTSDPLDAGTFEFSSFATSGTMVFKVETFAGVGLMPACKAGEGTASVPVVGMSIIKGEVVIKRTVTPTPCQNVTPPMDASFDL
ncbi:MAG: hypothetical protein JWM82_2349 [Myxococcales bacterium]|nr:hypothetical protein [Myxococcales bacterium]